MCGKIWGRTALREAQSLRSWLLAKVCSALLKQGNIAELNALAIVA